MSKERKLITRYTSIRSPASLKDVIKAMENKIDAELYADDSSLEIEYKPLS